MMRQTVFTIMTALAVAAPAVTRAQQPPAPPRVIIQGERQRPPRTPTPPTPRGGREEQSENFKKVVRLGGNGEIDINNIAGDIVFVRGGSGEATIEGTKVARGRTQEEAREMLEIVKVEITERGNRVEVKTNYPGRETRGNQRHNLSVSVNYTITAPAGTRISAHSVSGNVRTADMTGELSLGTVSGNVHVTRGKRLASAKTVSGNVEITDTDSDAGIDAGSISGDVLLRHVKTPKVEVGTVSGKVTMLGVDCPRIEGQSLSGDVEFTGAFARGGRYEFNSHSGNVRVAVTSGVGFEVEATSWSGSINSDLALTGNRRQEANPRGPRTKTVRGTVGDGSAILDITTFSGSVWIGKK